MWLVVGVSVFSELVCYNFEVIRLNCFEYDAMFKHRETLFIGNNKDLRASSMTYSNSAILI